MTKARLETREELAKLRAMAKDGDSGWLEVGAYRRGLSRDARQRLRRKRRSINHDVWRTKTLFCTVIDGVEWWYHPMPVAIALGKLKLRDHWTPSFGRWKDQPMVTWVYTPPDLKKLPPHKRCVYMDGLVDPDTYTGKQMIAATVRAMRRAESDAP